MAKQQVPKNYIYLAYKGKEYLWLTFVVIALVLSVYSLIKGDREQSLYFIVLTIFAGLLFSFNRSRRKKLQAEAEENNSKK